MNYQKIYDDICKRGQERILSKEVYTEKHHIIPKCLGGGNEKSNLTVLTAREHFLVHLILASKLFPKNPKLWNACFKMCQSSKNQNRYIPNSKTYNEIKSEWNKLNRGENHPLFGKLHSESHRKAIGDAHRGKTVSIETRTRMSEVQTGKKRSNEHKQKISEYFTKNNHNSRKCIIDNIEFISVAESARYFNISVKVVKSRLNSEKNEWLFWQYIDESKVSDETKQKNRSAHLGKKHSEESKLKMGNKGEDNPFYRRTHSDETKRKISNAKQGRKYTDEQKAKHKECVLRGENHPNFGKIGELHPSFRKKMSEKFCTEISERQSGKKNSFYGRTHSDENRKKISEANSGELNSFYGKSHPPELMKQILLNNPQRKPCSIDGVEFLTRTSVKQYYKISDATLTFRLESTEEEWKEWTYLK